MGNGHKNSNKNDSKSGNYKNKGYNNHYSNNSGQNRNNQETNRGGQRRQEYSQHDAQRTSYVGAPYNFVSFPNKVYEYPENKLTAHNQMSEKLATGEISYEIKAETPIMIDNGKGQFCKDARGRYVIPESTMRGLIRNNVQILGLSGVEDDIDDYALMYRNVAYGVEKKRYNTVLGAKQLPISDGDKSYDIGVLLNVHVGKAKAFGYGNISLKITDAKKLDLEKAYLTEEALEIDPFCQIDVDEVIKGYKEEMNHFLGSRFIDELPHIKEFFMMKDSESIPDNEKTKYMSIEKKDYQS